MTRYRPLVLLSLALIGSSIACAPPLGGPTMPSGYVFSFRASDAHLWLPLPTSSLAARFPSVADLVVQVQDAQGHPVDGVPVEFALEPEWQQSASITPQQASTRHGRVRAILEPKTTGVIRVMARVENVTQAVAIAVSNPGASGAGSAEAGPARAPMTQRFLEAHRIGGAGNEPGQHVAQLIAILGGTVSHVSHPIGSTPGTPRRHCP